MRPQQRGSKRVAARAAPVDGQQGRLGQAFEVRSRRIVLLEGLQRVNEDAQVMVELRRAGVTAHQAEHRVGCHSISAKPVHTLAANWYSDRRAGKSPVVLIDAVVGLAIQIQHALHALEVAADAAAAVQWVGPEALRHERGVLDPPGIRATELEPQPDGRVNRLAPVAAGRHDGRLGIGVVSPPEPQPRRPAECGPPPARPAPLRATCRFRRPVDPIVRPTAPYDLALQQVVYAGVCTASRAPHDSRTMTSDGITTTRR